MEDRPHRSPLRITGAFGRANGGGRGTSREKCVSRIVLRMILWRIRVFPGHGQELLPRAHSDVGECPEEDGPVVVPHRLEELEDAGELVVGVEDALLSSHRRLSILGTGQFRCRFVRFGSSIAFGLSGRADSSTGRPKASASAAITRIPGFPTFSLSMRRMVDPSTRPMRGSATREVAAARSSVVQRRRLRKRERLGGAGVSQANL
jgi:hypothetical protein